MERRKFVSILSIAGIAPISTFERPMENMADKKVTTDKNSVSDRIYCSDLLFRISEPVLQSISEGKLKKRMPLEIAPNYNLVAAKVSYLEAFGRTVCGISPWLSLADDDTPEGQKRKILKEYYYKGIANAVDPSSPDYLNFRSLSQPLVDSAHLCQGILRAPKVLWDPLDKKTKDRFISELIHLRSIRPAYNNWLLFASMIETFLLFVGEEYEVLRILIGVKKIQEWYKGDGWYSDGNDFTMDYYNSYVIQPMLVDILKICTDKKIFELKEYEQAILRMKRYAIILERMIAPDGTYPALGRSMTYRTGAFQPLAQLAYENKLPEELSPAQVRCAMTAVMKRIFEFEGTFDENGWLQLGICGHQPEAADIYTSTGSLYNCLQGFLALGLPADAPFWNNPAADWTSKKIWAGKKIKADHAIHL